MIKPYHILFGLAVASFLAAIGSISEADAKGWSDAQLREWGSRGLTIALESYDMLLAEKSGLQKRLDQEYLTLGPDEIAKIEHRINALEGRLKRYATRVDEIGGQRGCTVSRLYWHTDLEKAKAASVETGRPILSLRMLGKLTDEYSCANSRFFRTALYSNKKLSDFLRTNFVLHWQSVRPVPVVTIDFGDGRTLKRTVTGNSAHLVLASDGAPIDVLPGLYSPLAFHQWASGVASFHDKYQRAPAADRGAVLAEYHRTRHAELLKRWDFDIQRLTREQEKLIALRIEGFGSENDASSGATVEPSEAPSALAASKQAVTKTIAETPVLRFAKLGGDRMEKGMDDAAWQAIADLYRRDVKLDEASINVVRNEAPLAEEAARAAVSKYMVEDPILRLVRAFEEAITLDTVRNEYLLHRKIHEKFAERAPVTTNSDTLNEWVYAELFLTPSSDPWLGLAPRDVYSALEGDGRTEHENLAAGRTGVIRKLRIE